MRPWGFWRTLVASSEQIEGGAMSTITEHPNAVLIRRGYEDFNAADLEALSGLFSPDITLLQPGRGRLSALYDGRDAVFGFFGQMAAETGGTFRAELRELYANDTQVVAVHTATATRGGETLSADAALVFELNDGVVTAITVHQRRQEEWDEFWS
jgi:ketosteroid isomerase-like protein